MLLPNIRGIKSKEHSLKKILRKVKPSVVLINETQLIGNMKVALNPYTSWTRSRTETGGGGIATVVSQQYSDSTVEAGRGVGDDEFLITRLEAFYPALNIVNSYGEQRKTKKEDVEDKWRRLRKEMEDIRMRGEFCLLGGDLNKLVGQDEFGVPGNSPEISLGGRLLRELLATKDWVLVNSLGREVVQGGPFTRKDPATGHMSCLDMVVVSRELVPYISKLVIDDEKKMTPARAVKNKGKYKLVYTDHLSCLLTLNNLPRKQDEVKEKSTCWNLRKENGWKEYTNISNSHSEALEKVIDDEKASIQESVDKFEKVLEKIKFKAFGKVTITNRENREKYTVKRNNTKKEAKEMYEEQFNIVEN